ncbi:cystathionine beta-l [Ceraceosorus guamensis]|uniref:Cystathionine beta-lyase n=1 Tax=Ceraceosorus guamensis TaxID=1522189 RepID=A0A316W300_9BASI|nr:cystathionine beta-l [Ceraceosorus guamensis]PWN42035.1 cystathionine beta-l [Ceraceosorus guamensis]
MSSPPTPVRTSSEASSDTMGLSTTMGSATSLATPVDSAPTSPSPSVLNVPVQSKSSESTSKPRVAAQDRRSGPSGHRFATTCATVDDPNHKDQYGSSSTPIYMSATFKGLPGAEFDYSRSGNPTRSMLQHHLCQLQNCRYSFAVSSGMACLDVITRLLKAGERIIAGDDLYGGTNRLLTYLATHGDIKTDHVDTTDADKVQEILERRAAESARGECGKVKMVLLETPTNPLLKICDLERCARAAKRFAPEAIVVVDNTMMSPYLMRPLELGIDVVYDSGTKYLSGHHDLMAGVIACDREDVGKQIAFTVNSIGNALTPMDSFLLLRGIKTLAVRMDKQQTSSKHVAQYLHSLGFKVNYPGLASHPGKDIHDRQASGPGAVLSFETGDKELSERIVGATRLWGISVSFGCVNSLISMPCLMSHASIDPKIRAARRLPEDLIRLCVGIEDCRDLIEDLEAALLQAGAIKRKSQLSSAASTHTGQSTAEGHVAAAANFERIISSEADEPVASLNSGLATASLETRGGDPLQGLPASSPADANSAAMAAAAPASLLVSAPGKVILFGEHAVVHGVTAIAASVALRCYAHVASRADAKVSLTLPDLGTEHTWALDELPWDLAPSVASWRGVHKTPETLNELLHHALETLVGAVAEESERSHAASVAFLYLYLCIAPRSKATGQAFVLRSTLPIGAGLGSSASLSSCIASALLVTHGRIAAPTPGSVISRSASDLINSYAFLSEKVIHGNPSGVDNSVATHGGALAFARASSRTGRRQNELRSLHGFKSFRFLLTDTRVGRDTKSLVAGVGAKLTADPQGIGATLTAIQAIADDAENVLGSSTSRQAQLSSLARLIDENHTHLVSLGVSHPALETIKQTTAGAGLSTKLTGAGGGGCAVTLVPDDFEEIKLRQLVSKLEGQGFTCYETLVGGPGVGALSPHSAVQSSNDGQAAREALINSSPEALTAWADKAGAWIHSDS